MTQFRRFITLFLLGILLVQGSFLVNSLFTNSSKVRAGSQCPAGYTDRQCLEYLSKILADLNDKKKQVDGTLNNVRYQEGDLRAQVNFVIAQIQSNEITINQKQVEVELRSIEIRNVGNEIVGTKDKIDTLTQETQKAIQQINDTVMLSYKLQTIPTWYLLSQSDLISTLEMIHYFDYIVKSEQDKLDYYNHVQSQLTTEQKLLASAQSEIIAKRDELEQDNLDLIKLKDDLKSKQAQKTQLLATLSAQEKQLEAQRATLVAQQNAADKEALTIAIKLFEAGGLRNGTPVNRGDIIGREGYTGCSAGAHLHYGFISGTGSYTTNVNPFSAGLLSGANAVGSRLGDARAKSPLAGATVSGTFHDRYSLDMVARGAGNQDTSKKYIVIKSACWAQVLWGEYNLIGWGAPIYAALDGTVFYGTDSMGGKYAIIDHGNVLNGTKLKSIYWHLDGSAPNTRLK